MILITGIDGYIGSHMASRLASLQIPFIGLDRQHHKNIPQLLKTPFIDKICKIEICDMNAFDNLNGIIKLHDIKTVFHFAAFKSIPESLEKPVKYLRNNINSTTNLLKAMAECKCEKIIFSSSASVYGNKTGAIKETYDVSPTNPYALSKLMCEQIIEQSGIDYVILRYFNPIGDTDRLKDFAADGLNFALRQPNFVINGKDYKTPDGTPVRDFIPIYRLIDAHMHARFWKNEIVNIGTGVGMSVEQICDATGVKYTYGPRRKGDIEAIWADTEKYESLIKAKS